jgi:formate-dependent nitrite reductase membrane component NrfD
LFWLGVAIAGLLLPLTLELIGVFSLSGSDGHITVVIASIFGIIGGLILRQVILSGGIHAPLKSGRFEYGLTNV